MHSQQTVRERRGICPGSGRTRQLCARTNTSTFVRSRSHSLPLALSPALTLSRSPALSRGFALSRSLAFFCSLEQSFSLSFSIFLPTSNSPMHLQLLVKNIGDRTDGRDLKEAFERYGQVKDVYIPTDFHTR